MLAILELTVQERLTGPTNPVPVVMVMSEDDSPPGGIASVLNGAADMEKSVIWP